MNDGHIDQYLGDRLRRRRRILGMTQQALAEACGVNHRQIHKFERGDNRLAAAKLWVIARALGVPISYFFEGIDFPAGAPGRRGEGRSFAS